MEIAVRQSGRILRVVRFMALGLTLMTQGCMQRSSRWGPQASDIDVNGISDDLKEGMPLTYAMVRTVGVSHPALVVYELEGSMTAGKDYVPPAGQVAMPAGATQVQWDVLTIDDNEPEWTESLNVRLPGDLKSGWDQSRNGRPKRRPRAVDWELRRLPEGLGAALGQLPYGGVHDLSDLVTCSVIDERLQVQVRAPEQLTQWRPHWEAGLPFLISIRESEQVWTICKTSGWAWGSRNSAIKLVRYDPDEHGELAMTAVVANAEGMMITGHSDAATGRQAWCVALIQTGWEVILSHRLASDNQPRFELAANLTALRWRADEAAYRSMGQAMARLGVPRGAILADGQ